MNVFEIGFSAIVDSEAKDRVLLVQFIKKTCVHPCAKGNPPILQNASAIVIKNLCDSGLLFCMIISNFNHDYYPFLLSL